MKVKQRCEGSSRVEEHPQNIVQYMHASIGCGTHKQSLVETSHHLHTEDVQHHSNINMLLSQHHAALLLNEASSCHDDDVIQVWNANRMSEETGTEVE